MQILQIDPEHPSASTLASAAALLQEGRLVAFPTETVYGLGAHALDAAAVERIYAAKGRPAHNPLIVHVADQRGVDSVAREWSGRANALAAAFWPGPLTIIVPKRRGVPDAVTAGLDTVAVRIPAHPVALALLRVAGIPVAAPSANRSTELSPTSAQHVAKSLGPRVDLILDGGDTFVGIESTVVDVTRTPAIILRPGAITAEAIGEVLGEDVRIRSTVAAPGEAQMSPGTAERHYAPRARVLLVDPHEGARAAAEIREARACGSRVAALVIHASSVGGMGADVVPMPDEAVGYARRLYATLHSLDDAGYTLLIIERPPDEPAWTAIRDRLERASK